MVRRWQVPPDESGTMSREALIGALIDASALLDIAGGTLSVVVGRQPTNLPGEMVMTGAVLEWRDRTDAKAQPEAPSTVTRGTVDVMPDGEVVGQGTVEFKPSGYPDAETFESDAEPEPEVAALAEVRSEADEDNPDGFDYRRLEAEDIEEPEPAR